jgi:signal transduction histidine kinase
MSDPQPEVGDRPDVKRKEGLVRAPIRLRITRFGVVLGLACTAIWAISGGHYFWPGWIWLGLLLPWAFVVGVRWATRSQLPRSLALNVTVSMILGAVLVVVWLLSNAAPFWPIWPLIGLGIVIAAHALLPPWPIRRERELVERVNVLTRTRRDVLNIQAAELRRVERDLHDGAQARLVSLGMSLGMADELVDTDPTEARRLVNEARAMAADALADLRALVRGIFPAVLADRGLAGAIQALVLAVPIPVTASIELPAQRLSPPIEAAAYFTIAELLTNVVKHSGASSARIEVSQIDDQLVMVVSDDGRGGVDPERGSGLQGIRLRLEAFDGTLQLSSPRGGPTIVKMEVPCEPSLPKTMRS